MNEVHNTMTQENRQEIWCSACQNEGSANCKYCVFAGTPTRYKSKRPIIVNKK